MPNPIYDVGYRYATCWYTLDGVSVDFEFNFDGGYISEDYVRAFYRKPDNTEIEVSRLAITFVGPNQLRIPEVLEMPSDYKMIIRRMTPKNLPLVDFTNNSILNERNLDKNTKQAIHGVAEMVDLFADQTAVFSTSIGNFDGVLPIINNMLSQLENALAYLDELINRLSLIDVDEVLNILNNLSFLLLNDTPDSYVGHNGKLVSVDETNNKLVFKTINEILTEAGITIGGGGGTGSSYPRQLIYDNRLINYSEVNKTFFKFRALNALNFSNYSVLINYSIPSGESVYVGIYKNGTMFFNLELVGPGNSFTGLLTIPLAVNDTLEFKTGSYSPSVTEISITLCE